MWTQKLCNHSSLQKIRSIINWRSWCWWVSGGIIRRWSLISNFLASITCHDIYCHWLGTNSQKVCYLSLVTKRMSKLWLCYWWKWCWFPSTCVYFKTMRIQQNQAISINQTNFRFPCQILSIQDFHRNFQPKDAHQPRPKQLGRSHNKLVLVRP